MIRYLLSVTALAFLLTLGCAENTEAQKKAAEAKKKIDEKAAAEKKAIDKAADKMDEAAKKVRAEYTATINTELDKLNVKIAEYNKKAGELKGDAKIQAEKTVNELESKREKLKADLKDLSNDTGKAWDEIKAGFEKSWNDFKDSVNKASDKFK